MSKKTKLTKLVIGVTVAVAAGVAQTNETSPEPDNRFIISSIGVTSTHVNISFANTNSTPSRVLYGTTNLPNAVWVPVRDAVPTTNGVTFSRDNGLRFFQLGKPPVIYVDQSQKAPETTEKAAE